MKQEFKAYVRVDSRNRIVPGSLVLRRPRQRPGNRDNGKWLEINPYLCCSFGESGTPQNLAAAALVAPNSYTATITSGGLTETVNTGTTTVSALAAYLSSNYASVGSFVANGSNVVFTPSSDGATVSIGQGIDGQNVLLPTLTGGNPNYHITIENISLTTGDVNTGTTTPATLQTFLTATYGADGTFTLNGSTSIVFKPINEGTLLDIQAGPAV